MKKRITGLVLLTISMSQAHFMNDKKQAAEAMKARISMLKEKINAEHMKEEQLKISIADLRKSGKSTAQLSILVSRLGQVQEGIKPLEDELAVKENSLKPLITIP